MSPESLIATLAAMTSLSALGLGLYLLQRVPPSTPDAELRKAFTVLEDEWESFQTSLRKELGRVSRMKREVGEIKAAPEAQPLDSPAIAPKDPYDRAALYAMLKSRGVQ